MERNRADIAVTPDGPYELRADLPITPKRAVVSERGDPLTWQTAEELPHPSLTLLCRCGQSGTKPFCDDSHLTVNFDGTESASTETFADRRKTYDGPGLRIHHVGRLCEHASFCANETTDWFQMLPDTSDTNVRAQVIGMVEHCPSGALVCEIDGEIVEPDIPRAVSPVEDGPLWVTGNVNIERSDGAPLETRNRVTLCRCGESKNKPMCDGTHADVGFVAKRPFAQPIGGSLQQATDTDAAAGITSQIIVGVCESTAAETYGVAAMIARAGSSNVSVVHAGRRGSDSDRVVSSALGLVEKAGVVRDRLDSEVRAGSPPAALAEAATDLDAGLMIVGRGSDRLARIARQILHRAPCDVLVAARGADRPERYRHILVATDGSATADRAAKRGFGLARALGAEVHLVFIGHPATGRLMLADTIEVYGRGVATRSRLLRGSPLKRILGTAAAIDADLIVVGNRGMTKARMLLKTSVPGGVLKGARCDVLLCRTVRQLESELEPGDGGVIERNGEELAAFVDQRGELHLMSARCPHLGCVVAWNPTDSTFDCPCHGSTFGPLGEVLDGPASKPLRPV